MIGNRLYLIYVTLERISYLIPNIKWSIISEATVRHHTYGSMQVEPSEPIVVHTGILVSQASSQLSFDKVENIYKVCLFKSSFRIEENPNRNIQTQNLWIS